MQSRENMLTASATKMPNDADGPGGRGWAGGRRRVGVAPLALAMQIQLQHQLSTERVSHSPSASSFPCPLVISAPVGVRCTLAA